MRKIEAGYYRDEIAGFDIFQVKQTVYTGKAYKNHSSASYRTDTSWTLKIGDKLWQGLGSKKEAMRVASRHFEQGS